MGKIAGAILVLDAFVNLVINFPKIWGATKMIDIASVPNFFSKWGLIIIGIVAGLVYLLDKCKIIWKKVIDRRDQIDNLQKDLKDHCYSVAQLQKELSEARTERAKIRSDNNDVYNRLSTRLDNLEGKGGGR